MRLSVVVPSYNSGDTIEELLISLGKQECDYPWEIIIADYGSTDNTLETVRKFSERIKNLKVVKAEPKKGPPFSGIKGLKSVVATTFSFVIPMMWWGKLAWPNGRCLLKTRLYCVQVGHEGTES